jgi:hypothetical protein
MFPSNGIDVDPLNARRYKIIISKALAKIYKN